MPDQLLDITKEYAQLSQRTATALEGLQDVIKVINDNSVLHSTMVKELVAESKSLTAEIKNINEKTWKLILIFSAALIILAGANKVLEFVAL